MGKLKRILNKLLFPGAAVVLICVPAAAALLIYAFMYAGEDSPERVLYLWLQGTVGQAFLSSQGYLEAEE